jgi:MFS family permease
MVRSFQSVDGNYTALYASMLVSIFTFCEFLSNMPWAWVADRMGRKYTLLIGIIGGIVSTTMSPLSRKTVSRAIGGLMNPNVGVVQTCIGELAKKEQQGQTIRLI